MKSTFKTSINAWLQECDVGAVFDCLKYKIGIHPALLDSRFKYTHNCLSAGLLSTIPTGTEVMALSYKYLWNKQSGSNNMHHQICISQTTHCETPPIPSTLKPWSVHSKHQAMDDGKDMMWKQFLIVRKMKLGSIRLCLIHDSSTRTRFRVLGCCLPSRLESKWWRCAESICKISNREATICTIKSVSAHPQNAKLSINTKHTVIMKCTFKTSINAWLQGCDVGAVFDCLNSI